MHSLCPPLPTPTEQAAVLNALRESNDKSNYFYRGCTLFLLALTLITYLTPVPAYIMGTHPENHLTLFFRPHDTDQEHTHEDLVYLPAAPIYIIFFLMQGFLVLAAARETADKMGLIHGVKSRPFPAQPHPFGTAPEWLVPALTDVRFSTAASKVQSGERADTKQAEANLQKGFNALPPRLVYLLVLTFASLPMPLMTFGAGAFTNAAWWSISTAALVLLCFVEWSIHKSERQLGGLARTRYDYKGA